MLSRQNKAQRTHRNCYVMCILNKLLLPIVSFIIGTIIIVSPENISAGKTGPHTEDIDTDVLKLSTVF
jgi:hypothetical protein